jgi:hypothetical protein
LQVIGLPAPTATTATTLTSPTIATIRGFLARACFVDTERLPLELPTVGTFNCGLGLFGRRHLNKPETSRFAAQSVLKDGHSADLSKFGKDGAQIVFIGFTCEVSHVDIHLFLQKMIYFRQAAVARRELLFSIQVKVCYSVSYGSFQLPVAKQRSIALAGSNRRER